MCVFFINLAWIEVNDLLWLLVGAFVPWRDPSRRQRSCNGPTLLQSTLGLEIFRASNACKSILFSVKLKALLIFMLFPMNYNDQCAKKSRSSSRAARRRLFSLKEEVKGGHALTDTLVLPVHNGGPTSSSQFSRLSKPTNYCRKLHRVQWHLCLSC